MCTARPGFQTLAPVTVVEGTCSRRFGARTCRSTPGCSGTRDTGQCSRQTAPLPVGLAGDRQLSLPSGHPRVKGVCVAGSLARKACGPNESTLPSHVRT